jgi:hypothetical protein
MTDIPILQYYCVVTACNKMYLVCAVAVSINPSNFITHREFRKTAEYEGGGRK